MSSVPISLDEALDLTRTGDVWVFRGRKMADRAIQVTTNSPVNHVGMSVVIEDLPPLMWHAELGQSLPDVWTGTRHRGVQLHDLRDAVLVWAQRYGQRAWFRQLHAEVTPAMETKTREVMELLEITHLAGRNTLELSSGEARRILIARALVHDPRALVLDEPSNSLDLHATHELRETLRKLARNGITILMVTHFLPDIIPEMRRVVLIREGRVYRDGAKEEVLTPSNLSALFGIEVEVLERGGYYHVL